MEKIVTITRNIKGSTGSAAVRLQAGARCGAGDPGLNERTRGLLVQFPGPFDGPLPAA
jgi:hypothetical protein